MLCFVKKIELFCDSSRTQIRLQTDEVTEAQESRPTHFDSYRNTNEYNRNKNTEDERKERKKNTKRNRKRQKKIKSRRKWKAENIKKSKTRARNTLPIEFQLGVRIYVH